MISKLINPNIEDKENLEKKSKTLKNLKTKYLNLKKMVQFFSKKKKNRKKKSKDFTKKKVY